MREPAGPRTEAARCPPVRAHPEIFFEPLLHQTGSFSPCIRKDSRRRRPIGILHESGRLRYGDIQIDDAA